MEATTNMYLVAKWMEQGGGGGGGGRDSEKTPHPPFHIHEESTTVKPLNLAARIFSVFSHTDNLATIKFSVLTFIDNKLLLLQNYGRPFNLAFKIFSAKFAKYNYGTLKFLVLQYYKAV